MSEVPVKPLPVMRMTMYLIILGICGGIALYELYCVVVSDTAMATVLTVGTTKISTRSVRIWIEYEYLDSREVRHTGKAEDVPPTTRVGEQIEIQYDRHSPGKSRVTPSSALGLCTGFVAMLAAVVFGGELITWITRR